MLTNYHCLYCQKKIDRYTLYSLYIEEDSLCLDCRKKLNLKVRKFQIDDCKAEYLYDYNSLFKSILLQYKECYDEALSICFLYKIDIYLYLKYWNYQILYVPSTKTKIKERGFNHLKLIFEQLGLKEVNGLKMKEEIIQKGKSVADRQKMINNYYYEGSFIKRLLIVDDVYTSGSSLKGVLKAMKSHYKKVKIVLLSRA